MKHLHKDNKKQMHQQVKSHSSHPGIAIPELRRPLTPAMRNGEPSHANLTGEEGVDHERIFASVSSFIDDGHNEDLLNETLKEVLRIPSVPILHQSEQDNHGDGIENEDDNKSEDSDGIYDDVMDINIHGMLNKIKSINSEALYDDDRIIDHGDTKTLALSIEDNVNQHIVDIKAEFID
eukprot:CAMPEP_0201574420 /NCGR_PEP_ID=MMETSP0190_2-20130828/18888_1 /ASSEMBLY_ACC=CAM_ASM_000263 /TAXON_ID=37353 /ORGANISM="Rosalina sp." /LENGTH=178 /DNA_ID=CAMNT_0048002637 /DNA_START=551 /DNA_END=1087 /DNA_ORIENTATION=+